MTTIVEAGITHPDVVFFRNKNSGSLVARGRCKCG